MVETEFEKRGILEGGRDINPYTGTICKTLL